jgi:hypothetical protein
METLECISFRMSFSYDIESTPDSKSFKRSFPGDVLAIQNINPEHFLPLRAPLSSVPIGMCQDLVTQAISYPGFHAILGAHPRLGYLFVEIIVTKLIHEDELQQVQT